MNLCAWLLTIFLLSNVPVCCFAEDLVLAKVNGLPIHSSAVQGELFLRQLPDQATSTERQQVIERLIDRELIRQFLVRRKVTADPEQVESRVQAIRRLLEMKGENPDEVLKRFGLDDSGLKGFLALPIAWRRHVATVVTEPMIREEYLRSGARFDGTRVTASQIVRFVEQNAPESDWLSANEFLESLRRRIESGEVSFADAARMHSDSPSAANGGDLGAFEFQGRVARALAEVAFALKPGEISQPVRSSTGVHLIRVDLRQPGDLSPEDVRPQLLDEIAARLWQEQIARERQSAKIQIP